MVPAAVHRRKKCLVVPRRVHDKYSNSAPPRQSMQLVEHYFPNVFVRYGEHRGLGRQADRARDRESSQQNLRATQDLVSAGDRHASDTPVVSRLDLSPGAALLVVPAVVQQQLVPGSIVRIEGELRSIRRASHVPTLTLPPLHIVDVHGKYTAVIRYLAAGVARMLAGVPGVL